jgi:hypothetical protein
MERALNRLVNMFTERPVLAIFAIAFFIRFVVAVGSNALHDGTLIPDEGQYLIVATLASKGELSSGMWGGHMTSLWSASRTFFYPLTAMFWLFGPSRFIGQLLPVLFGAVTAAATTAMASSVLRRSYALLAGLIVALFPSQVILSSVVLRESFVWAGLAGAAVAVGYFQRQDSTGRIVGSGLLAALSIFAIFWLRLQTAALALWCLFFTLLTGRGRRSLRVLSAVCVLAVVPWLAGAGPGAITFLESGISRAGSTHAWMALKAESSFLDLRAPPGTSDRLAWEQELSNVQAPVDTNVQAPVDTNVQAPVDTNVQAPVDTNVQAPVDEDPRSSNVDSLSAYEKALAVDSLSAFENVSAEDCASHIEEEPGSIHEGWFAKDGDRMDLVSDVRGSQIHERSTADWVCLGDGEGGSIIVDNRLRTTLSRAPRGLFDTMVRPLPWEASWSNIDKFGAVLESPVWIVLYGLSAYGIWKRRRNLRQLLFPVLIVGAIATAGAVTHGNLGTALRHREQMLFAFAFLSAAGLQAIADRRDEHLASQGVAGPTSDAPETPISSPDPPGDEGR